MGRQIKLKNVSTLQTNTGYTLQRSVGAVNNLVSCRRRGGWTWPVGLFFIQSGVLP